MTWHILEKQDLFTKLCSFSHRYSTSKIAHFSKQFVLLWMSKVKYSALTSIGCAFVICRATSVFLFFFFLVKKNCFTHSFGKCWLFGHFHVNNAPLNNILAKWHLWDRSLFSCALIPPPQEDFAAGKFTAAHFHQSWMTVKIIQCSSMNPYKYSGMAP